MIENFGLYLKHERELRGVPLEEIAGTTKVHIRYLEALENNNFDELPGEVFIKGYIRSYAKSIGFNAEEMLNAYDDSIGKNRREELQGGQAEKERTRSRNKGLAKFALLGLILIGLVFVGKVVMEIVVNKYMPEQANLSTPVETSQVEDAAAPSEDVFPEEAEGEEELPPTLEIAEAPTSSAAGSGETEKKIDSGGNTPPLPVLASRELNEPEAVSEKIEATGAAPKPEVERSSPSLEKSESAKSPVESQEKEKSSDLSEKEVIIQQVVESSEEGAAAASSSDAQNKALHLLIQVQGNSWFNLTADDAEEKDFILPGGTSKSFYADEEFRITIGNRRGTMLFLNGESLDLPQGASDVVRDFKITANLAE